MPVATDLSLATNSNFKDSHIPTQQNPKVLLDTCMLRRGSEKMLTKAFCPDRSRELHVHSKNISMRVACGSLGRDCGHDGTYAASAHSVLSTKAAVKSHKATWRRRNLLMMHFTLDYSLVAGCSENQANV